MSKSKKSDLFSVVYRHLIIIFFIAVSSTIESNQGNLSSISRLEFHTPFHSVQPNVHLDTMDKNSRTIH